MVPPLIGECTAFQSGAVGGILDMCCQAALVDLRLRSVRYFRQLEVRCFKTVHVHVPCVE